jgi:hypothetical protein
MADQNVDQNFEAQELKHLANIENELEEIKRRTPTRMRAFVNGMLSGGGAIVGGIIAVILIGWVLAFFGFLPGFSYIAAYIKDALAQMHR